MTDGFDVPVSPTLELVITRGRVMRFSAAAYRWLREHHTLQPTDELRIAVQGSSANPDLLAIRVERDGLKVDPGTYTCSGVDVARLLGTGQRTARLPLEPDLERHLLIGRISAVLYPQAGGEPAVGAQANGSREAGLSNAGAAPEASGPPAHLGWCHRCGGHRSASSGVCPTCGALFTEKPEAADRVAAVRDFLADKHGEFDPGDDQP
jgi:hypothetical protein